MSRQFGLLLPLLLAAPAPPASSATTEPDIAGMWRELERHCSAGRCTRATGSRADDSSAALWQDKITDSPTGAATDCKGRMLAYEYGLKLLPSRKPQLESFDALELHTTCGVSRPRASKPLVPDLRVPTGATFHVDHAFGSDSAGGSVDAPFRTIHRALAECRASSADAKNIVLKPGVHYLNETIDLGPADSGTTITAARGSAPGDVVVSGGALLTPTWKKSSRKSPNASAGQIWETKVPAALGAFKGLTTLSPHRRVTRARFPNAGAAEGAELCTGHCWASGIKEWHKNTSCVGKATVVYKDLRDCDDNMKIASGPLAGQPCKNDSAMWDTYNTYSSGHGGCCAAWSGDQSPYGPMGNYFCGNASAGGWVGFNDPRGMPGSSGITGSLDNGQPQGYNGSQGLSAQLPWGFNYDPEQFPVFDSIERNPAGAILHVWSHGWFVNMFEVESIDKAAHSVKFATAESYGWTHPKGGWQGGRGWEDTDHTPQSSQYFGGGGGWHIENFLEALDEENEWFLDAKDQTLYLIPNATDMAPAEEYIAVMLETLICINGTKDQPVKDITISGITFRDAADITMEPWGVPSGGDWGLYRGGAIFIEGAEGVTVANNTLTRLDGNAVFVSGYTRSVSVTDNEFSWIGCNPMASWGYTDENDGTDGQQPRYTYIARNYVHEFGHYQKQSSMWSNNKACLAQVEGNIIFNGPRAGINFNDGFGGGTNVTNNLIYNQCRESGDHGAMNSWDRTAYISDVLYGTPSYEAQMNSVDHNFIIANYGASQGFDTDDGSSWYDINNNFMFMADGWKMDYGGHDSRFTDNVVYHAHNDGQNCFNTWPFLPGHGAVWSGNKCILQSSTNLGNPGDGIVPAFHCPGNGAIPAWNKSETTTDTWRAQCGLTLENNQYYTSNVSGTTINGACPEDPPGSNNCGSRKNTTQPSFAEWTETYGNDKGSTLSALPTDEELLGWAREKLGMTVAAH